VTYLPLVVGALGIAPGYLVYMFREGMADRVKTMFAPVHNLFYRKWYFDEIYNAVFVVTSLKLGKFFWQRGDAQTIDGFGPNGVANSSQKLAGLLSRFQSGFVFQYAFVMMIGLIAIVTWLGFKLGLFTQ
jgi:NADH-quinone oxidoreductase subunit L